MTIRSLTPLQLESELHKLLEERKQKNPRYTISAFAKSIQMHESTLQKILRGERRLGFRLAQEIGSRLKIQVRPEPNRPRKNQRVIHTISVESKSQVSWIHMAILEMIKLVDFHPSTSWVATRLGLSETVTEDVLSKMEIDGLLRRETDRWNDLISDSAVATRSFVTSDGLRESLKEMLLLSAAKLDSVAYEKRENSVNFITVPTTMLPKIKERIRRFRWELCDAIQKTKAEKDEVYSLVLSFVPVTQKVGTL